MAKISAVVLIFGCVMHLCSCISSQDTTRLMKQYPEDNSPYQRLMNHQAQFNQRSTQYLNSQPSVSSRGALILPANNQIQASNFNSNLNNSPISRYQVNNNAQFTSPTITTTTTTATQPLNVKPSRLQRISNISSNTDHQVSATNSRSSYASQPGTIELALRQTSSDENVFQPLPSHDFNWLAHSTSPAYQQAPNPDPQLTSEGPEQGVEQSPQHPHQSSSTTEESNNIAQVDSNSVQQQEFQHQQHQYGQQQRKFSHHQSEYPSTLAENITGIELNNNFNYENTSPTPILTSDYYFSSAERLPHNERASNAWW